MRRIAPEPVAIAILAKAPVAGFAKTRLIPALGAEGAAALQSRLIAHTAEIVSAAATGATALWASPDESHPVFQSVKANHGIALARQPSADLGERMFAALAAARGPALVIGVDCPALTPDHVRVCAETLREGIDVVAIPAEDGGYVLLGTRRPDRRLFVEMPWGTASVMSETRSRLARFGFSWREPVRLWDIDRPEDLDRLTEINFASGK